MPSGRAWSYGGGLRQAMVTQPVERITVCGGTLASDAVAVETEYNGRTYYFCTRGCLRAFHDNPEDFLAGKIEHPLDDNGDD